MQTWTQALNIITEMLDITNTSNKPIIVREHTINVDNYNEHKKSQRNENNNLTYTLILED